MRRGGPTAAAARSSSARGERWLVVGPISLIGAAMACLVGCSGVEPELVAVSAPVPAAATAPLDASEAVPTVTAQASAGAAAAAPVPSAAATSVTSAPVPPQPVARRARLAFTGDVLSHGPVTRRARANGSSDLRFDYRPMFAQVRDAIAGADLAICHLESPLSADNADLSGYPLFNAPGDLAAALAHAGYDGCSTASNHSSDQGVEGIAETLESLERHRLGHAGMARTPAEAATPTVYRVNGIAIGHLSYTYGLNGLRLPPDRLWSVDVIAPGVIEAEARAARDAGAEFVVVSIQWGWEYTSRPNAAQRDLAAALLASPDIDLLVGSHAHVVQPVERIGDKYVIYGIGNFLTNQSPQSCRSCPVATVDGVIVEVEIAETPAGRIRTVSLGATPTWVERPAFTIVDVAGELAGRMGPNRRGVLERSWRRTARVLRAGGVELLIKGDPAGIEAASGAPDMPTKWPLAPR